MARKPASQRARRERSDEEGGGVVARLVDRTFENPATSGGLLVMALTATAIVSNALFLQSGRHPEPFFTGGAAPASELAAAPAPPVSAKDQTSLIIADPPVPRLAPRSIDAAIAEAASSAVEPPPALPPAAATTAPSSNETLIADIQRELARIGLYRGTIDGVSGPRTEAAISEFETAAGVAPTGTPSVEVLAALRQPLPPRETRSIASESAQAAELARREQERARLIADDQRAQEAARHRETYSVVQTALNRIGYGPLPVDGLPGADTEDAIRRFELDNGMPITGEAGDALIARLFAIGAIKPG